MGDLLESGAKRGTEPAGCCKLKGGHCCRRPRAGSAGEPGAVRPGGREVCGNMLTERSWGLQAQPEAESEERP